MSLPDLLKHIYHNATDEVIRRGKRIFHTAGVQVLESDTLVEQVVFRVRNDVYSNYYKVTVQNYLDAKKISLRCQCPYNMGTVCRHEAAALFQLNDLLQSGYFDNVHVSYDQKHTMVRMRQISAHFLRLFAGQAMFSKAEDWVADKRVTIIEAKDDTVKAEVRDDEGEITSVLLKQNEERYFDTSCSCSYKEHPLCVHKASVFLYVLNYFGGHYFSTLRNWDVQKNKLLSLYGYSLNDDIKGKFEFSYHDGKPFLRVLDPTIRRIALQPVGQATKTPAREEIEKEKDNPSLKTIRMGVLVDANPSGYFPFTSFHLISGEPDEDEVKYIGLVERVELNQYISPAGLKDRDKLLITALRKQGADELFKFIKRDSPFGEFWDSLPEEFKTVPGNELRKQAWEFYVPRYQRLLEHFQSYPFIYSLEKGKYFLTANLEKSSFAGQVFHTHITAKPVDDGIELSLNIQLGEDVVPHDEVTVFNAALIRYNGIFHAAAHTEIVGIMEQFDESGCLVISREDWPQYLKNSLLPLSGITAITFDDTLKDIITEYEPKLRLYLKETEKALVFKPVFDYDGVEKQWLDYTPAITATDGKVIVYQRDEATEQTFLTLLRHLHPSMQESRKSRSFLLLATEAMKGNWYFNFIEKLKENNVEVSGYEKLKQLRINPNKPVTTLQINSGIDWFDAEIEIAFGEEQVGIADVKRAVSKGQNYVSLKDGSIGLLSEEWMDQYGLMVKVGTIEKGRTLRLKRFHFSALEGLENEISNREILSEIAERRSKLMHYDFDRETQVDIPENVYADLRPYQKWGFQWMVFLQEVGWGGILADDMGLGKTLQTLTFLQYYLNNHPGAHFLVACPTTLIYNWENEIKKFTPSIRYRIHHGLQRSSNPDDFSDVDLIITTYGTLRSDVKMLSRIPFDYVVLDESQAIKNPLSQVAKASQMLQSKNRLALSGTPVQNNTFDLFAQMNFLNPGMLGSMEFFRNEFATPIDKLQEEDVKKHLRRLIRPFLLRRTKEQVAPDLPEKSETVLFCEMGAKQRKIYDSYRNTFRSQILGEIEEKGMDRSRFSILTGLMKLRQICDSPAILNGDEVYENHSVKIEELLRELTENTGKHKALVFSQFLGMLSLIRAELERRNIPYVYFDGSTSSSERERAIQTFQNDEECRVFLISLKAGGVGLNLTAADYVYIVDPWWNPAVEQQAIDRTHRIGQTKNIFAYRLICKDTIEEKILLLQERKLTLVKDLIADENAFMKQLTKEDVAYLLS